MSRISNSTFKVNSNLEQMCEISAISGGVTIPVSLDATHLYTTSNIAYVGGVGISLGQKASSASIPIVLPSDQTVNVDLDSVAGSALALGSAVSASSVPVVIASDNTVVVDVDKVGEVAISLGQKTASASFPVVIASDNTVDCDIDKVAGSAISLGQKVDSASFPVIIASDQSAVLTNIQKISGTAITLGQKAMTACLPVTLASDEDTVNTEPQNKGINETLATAQQVGNYAYDGSDWRRLQANASGYIKVEQYNPAHGGTQANMNNATSAVNGTTSSVVTVNNQTLLTIFGNSTASDGVSIQISADNTNWYALDFDVYPNASGDFYETLSGIATNYIRLKYNATTTVTATCLTNIQ